MLYIAASADANLKKDQNMKGAILVSLALFGAAEGASENAQNEQKTSAAPSLAQLLKQPYGGYGYEKSYKPTPAPPRPKHQACAAGCTCDGSLSIVSAYYGIKDVTEQVSALYKRGERHFYASKKMFGSAGGYEEEYPYLTLSITYQQFCKYASVVVPNFDLK